MIISMKMQKSNSQYYIADKLYATGNYENGFSILHFNCRRLPLNFKKVKESLIELNKIILILLLLLRLG